MLGFSSSGGKGQGVGGLVLGFGSSGGKGRGVGGLVLGCCSVFTRTGALQC